MKPSNGLIPDIKDDVCAGTDDTQVHSLEIRCGHSLTHTPVETVPIDSIGKKCQHDANASVIPEGEGVEMHSSSCS